MVHGLHTASVDTFPRVLVLLPESEKIGGCTYVRVTGPLSFLKEKGYPVDWMTQETARFLAFGGKLGISNYELVVFPRTADVGDGRVVKLVKLLNSVGLATVFETDDDYTNEFRHTIDGDANTIMNEVTAITVSTPHLRAQCAKHTKTPIYLLQNCIDLRFWNEQAVRTPRVVDGLTIGIVGTTTHYADWKLAKDALYQIGENYPDVNFVIGGFFPDYLQDLPRLTRLESVPYQEYPSLVRQVDIGLCPLVPDDNFNKSKSGIKAMEYWTAGAAVVASDCSVYNRVVDADRGALVSTTAEWYGAIKALIENPALRAEQVANGQKWIRCNRNMEHNSMFWWDVYAEVYQKYGGHIDEHIITQWAMGHGATGRKGINRDNVLPLSRPSSRRWSHNPDRADASRDRRRPAARRGS